MKRLTMIALYSMALLPLHNASADSLGRFHGYAMPPAGADTLPVIDAVIVDDTDQVGNHGRLSAYHIISREPGANHETMPLLAGMKPPKPREGVNGYGRLNGYADAVGHDGGEDIPVFDTTNIAIWQ